MSAKDPSTGAGTDSGAEQRDALRRLDTDDDARAWMQDLQLRVLPKLLESLTGEVDFVPEPGQVVGAYRLESELGRGSMGVVFLAHDQRLDRPVALKFLSGPAWRRGHARRSLLDEARAAARLDHPGIAVVHDIGETADGSAFIVMARYEGETLAARLARGPLAPAEAVDVARQVTDALSAAHRAGVVHRDIKPSNVILTPSGRIKVVDFGIAAREGDDAARRAGTLPYMSPEQLRGELVDGRSDIWSLGVILFEMLTGARPFRGDGRAEVVHAIRHVPFPAARERDPRIPEPVWDILRRCLEKQPADRYPSAEDLLAALLHAAPGWPRDATITSVDTGTRLAEAACRRGRHALAKGDPDSARDARDHFLAALDHDPGHAPAWCGLSDAYEVLAYLAVLPPEEAHVRARAAAERALELAPDLAEAHVSLATVLLDYYRRWDAAGESYRRALRLNPDYATGHQLYAEYLRDQGRFDEALGEIDEAIRLDPLSPYNRLVRGIVLHMARRHPEALGQFERILQATPDYPMAHFFIGLTCASAGKHARALEALERMDPEGEFPDAVAVRGCVLARGARADEARRAIRSLKQIGPDHHVLPFHEALVRLSLGELDRGLALLEEDAEQRSWFSRILAVEPLLDPVRDHPRFQALLTRVRSEGGSSR